MNQQRMTKKNTKMNKIEQVGGTHYQKPIQPWDEFRRLNVTWAQGEITKYLCRWPFKNGIRDLEKALSIAKKYQSPRSPRELRYVTYSEDFLEQYRDIYGQKYGTFRKCLKSLLRDEYYIVSELIEDLISYFKDHEPFEK